MTPTPDSTPVKSSWKTTLFGLASLVLAISSIFVNQQLSGKLQATAGILAGSGLVAAKDNKVQ